MLEYRSNDLDAIRKKMKKAVLIFALALPMAAMAQGRPPIYGEYTRGEQARGEPPISNVIQDTIEYAKVLDFKPIPGAPMARQVCNAVVGGGSEHNAATAVVGGLVGALVGSRFGGGRGRDAVTVAGAIGGAVVGDRVGSQPATTQQCNTIYEAGPPRGYDVTYEYQGTLGRASVENPPGQFLKVHKRITVE
jgi:uncharacterized protein YcfJ